MTALILLAGIVVLVVFLVVLRPVWTWGAVMVGALLCGDQLGAPPALVASVVGGLWLVWRGARLVNGRRS